VQYYANSIAHLLGPFEASVRAREDVPAASLSTPDLAGSHNAVRPSR